MGKSADRDNPVPNSMYYWVNRIWIVYFLAEEMFLKCSCCLVKRLPTTTTRRSFFGWFDAAFNKGTGNVSNVRTGRLCPYFWHCDKPCNRHTLHKATNIFWHCDKPCNRHTLHKAKNPIPVPVCDKHYKATNPIRRLKQSSRTFLWLKHVQVKLNCSQFFYRYSKNWGTPEPGLELELEPEPGQNDTGPQQCRYRLYSVFYLLFYFIFQWTRSELRRLV